MAWSTPKTWASGYIVLASDLNTFVRDQQNLTAPAVMSAQGDIVIASGANTPIRLAKSTTSTQYLANTGTSNAPAWNEVALGTGVSGVLPIANGGVGVALSDPDNDRILFWDDSAGAYAYLTAGTNLTITGTTMVSAGLAAVVDDTSPQLGGNLDMQARLLVGNGGSTGIAISSAGEVTMTAQPCIAAINSADDTNVTGNGTVFTCIFNTEIFDQNADFDGTSTFTAPVTGRYLISYSIQIQGLTTSSSDILTDIATSNRTWRCSDPGLPDGGQDNQQKTDSQIVDMDASDTATIAVTVNGEGSDRCLVAGRAGAVERTFFSVKLEA